MDADGRTRWSSEAQGRAASYDDRWAELAADGKGIHGEADFVTGLAGPGTSVLDAGCGTGRVAIELARRGYEVVGTDLDASMLDRARAKGPSLTWVKADLATLDLGRRFDLVVMAGNVMIYLQPGTEAAVVARLAAHLSVAGLRGPNAVGGRLVAGFQLDAGRLDLATYDRHAAAAGLELLERWATWDRDPYEGGGYAVSVHAHPTG